MTAATTGAGPDRVDTVHAAVIHGSDAELVDMVVPFLRDGLDAGEPTVLGVQPDQERLLLDALGDDRGVLILEPDRYARPYDAARLNARLFHELVDGGAARVRAVGTPPASTATWHGWSRYEAAIDRVLADLPVWGICLYDRQATADEVLADVERTHTHVTGPGGRHDRNPRYTDPASFLAYRAGVDVDPLEGTPPRLELLGPSPALARREVGALAGAAGLGDRVAQGLALAVTEVVTNAFVHGRPPVSVLAWAAADRVAVAVRDTGPGPADPFVGLVPGAAGNPDALGLHVAHQVCSEVTLDPGPGGFTVHLVARDD